MKEVGTYSVEEVMAFLEEHENANGKEVLVRHGAREPFFGTRIGYMKKLTKKIRKDHDLALALWETGNSDAMYFATLIADETVIDADQLRSWVRDAYWSLLSESGVASVAAETPHAFLLAREWIDDPSEMVAAAGWSVWCSLLTTVENDRFDTAELDTLLTRVTETLQEERNRVRYCMNQFLICLGAYHPAYTERAKEAARLVGTVTVDMGETACNVPEVTAYIEKVASRGGIGKKRPAARC